MCEYCNLTKTNRDFDGNPVSFDGHKWHVYNCYDETDRDAWDNSTFWLRQYADDPTTYLVTEYETPFVWERGEDIPTSVCPKCGATL